MSFQESLQNEMPVSYHNMLSGQTLTPLHTVADIEQYEAFERAFDNYHKRLGSEKKDFNNSLQQIIKRRDNRVRAENNAERCRRKKAEHLQFVCMECVKTFTFNIPTLVLFIISLILIHSPELILVNIHFGWIIGIFVTAFVATMIVAGIVVWKSNRRSESYGFIKKRCAITIAGAFTFIILMSFGLGFIQNHTYVFSDSVSLNSFIDNAPDVDIEVEFSNNFTATASKGLEIKDGQVAGLGSCSDKYVFIDKPVKNQAFNDSYKFYKRKVFLVDGCNSIGDQAFRKCSLNEVYFMQTEVPNIGYDVFGYTWDSANFCIYVPENLFDDYCAINDSTWQTYVVNAGKIKTYNKETEGKDYNEKI